MRALERFVCMATIILMIVIVMLECEYFALDTAIDCNNTTYYNLTLMNCTTEESRF